MIRPTPAVVLVMGLPGTGKSTFAIALAQQWRALHINSDRVRAEMNKRGQYAPQDKAAVYQAMLNRMEQACRMGKRVVLDATFSQTQLRAQFWDAIHQLGKTAEFIEIVAAEEIIQQRIQKKRTYSEADFQVYEKIKAQFAPLKVPHLILDSGTTPVETMVKKALDYLQDPSQKDLHFPNPNSL